MDSCHPFPGDCWQAFLLINHSLIFFFLKRNLINAVLQCPLNLGLIHLLGRALTELRQNNYFRRRAQEPYPQPCRWVLVSPLPCLSSLLIVFVVGFSFHLPHHSPMTVLLSVNASTFFIIDLCILPKLSWILVPRLDVFFLLWTSSLLSSLHMHNKESSDIIVSAVQISLYIKGEFLAKSSTINKCIFFKTLILTWLTVFSVFFLPSFFSFCLDLLKKHGTRLAVLPCDISNRKWLTGSEGCYEIDMDRYEIHRDTGSCTWVWLKVRLRRR